MLAAARANGEYVGDSGIFLQPVGWNDDPSDGFSNMPAIILQKVPEPEHAILLWTLFGLVGGAGGVSVAAARQ